MPDDSPSEQEETLLMAETVDIAGLSKAAVLHALVTNGRPMGMGLLQARDFSIEDAERWIENGWSHDYDAGRGERGRNDSLYFDYVTGVPLKANIAGDELDTWGYDRDHGPGAAERAIAGLRERMAA